MTQFDLHHGDCLARMAKLPATSVDLVVTSPPYNLGIAYRKYSDKEDRETYLTRCHDSSAQIRRILKPAGSFFLNIGSAPSNSDAAA